MFTFLLPKKSMLTDPKINKYIMERDYKLGLYNKRASGIVIKQSGETNENIVVNNSGFFIILASFTSFCYYFFFRKSLVTN
jgi:hypothetical protein